MAATRFGLAEHQVFWNERGEVACATCPIPFPGSDTWVWDGWAEITPEVMVEIASEGQTIACHYCGREPRRIHS